jgi:exosortase
MKDKLDSLVQSLKELPRDQRAPLIAFVALVAALLYSYADVFSRWVIEAWEQPQYSHGYLIPVFTLALLLMRREAFGSVTNRERLIGVAGLLGSLGLRALAAWWRISALDIYSFVPALLSCLMLVGGWRFLRWAGPAVLFLSFMFPLSYKMERVVLDPLQKLATIGGTYALETTGIETYADGNQIKIRDNEGVEQNLTVAEACSGLRMLTMFAAMCFAMVLILPGALWEKIVIVASAIPIALFANVSRITVYGILRYFDGEVAEYFHEGMSGLIASLFMMALGMGILYLEYVVLQKLVVDESKVAPVPVFGVSPSLKRSSPISTART